MSNGVRYTPTFAMPSEYERQSSEARRRRRMAEMLAAQAYQPQEGGVAPIPTAAPLVQGLQAFLTARQLRKAEEAEEKAKSEETRTGEAIMNRLMGGAPVSTAPGPSPTDPLTGVTVESQFKKDPAEALRLASTPAGMNAMRGNPMMAAMLQKSMEEPAAEEFYAPTETAEGLVQFGKRGGRKVTGFKASPKATNLQQDYEFAQSQGYKGTFEDFRNSGVARTNVDVRYGAPVQGVDPQGNPVFFQPNPTGGPPVIIQGVKPEEPKLTSEEKTGRLYASRMAQAETVFEGLSVPGLGERAKEGIPFGVGNLIITPESRQFFQAERNFINATLRRESGAVISPEEFDNARKQYIPQPGDDPVTLEQKRQNRKLAIQLIGSGTEVSLPSQPNVNFSSQGKISSNSLSPQERNRLDELRRKRASGG